MTPEEVDYYLSVCQHSDPDALLLCFEMYAPPDWMLAAAEIGYWHIHRRVEASFFRIEQVIDTGNGLIYVHKPRGIVH